jgi:uncharacterized membrane protein YbhN (UPF0104 family)
VTRVVRWGGTRVLLGVAVLAVVVWRLGTGPFAAGVRQVDGVVLVVAVLVGVGTTVSAAWRWQAIAGALGVTLPLRTAVAFSYRAQLLNSVLPGGVLGDVHRGARHGLDSGDLGRGLRAVLWDRTTGQVVQVVLTVAALFLLPSPFEGWVPAVVALGLALLVAVALGGARRRGSRVGAVARTAVRDLRAVARAGTWPTVVLASALAVAGYVVTFLVAARAVGVDTSVTGLVPVALLVLLAMAVPFNVAGWGPREGAAAWAFAAAGLGASTGVSVAVVYGVMSLAATAPGAVVLVGSWLRDSHVHLPGGPPTDHTAVPLEGAEHG